MPAGALVTLGARPSAGMVLTTHPPPPHPPPPPPPPLTPPKLDYSVSSNKRVNMVNTKCALLQIKSVISCKSHIFPTLSEKYYLSEIQHHQSKVQLLQTIQLATVYELAISEYAFFGIKY